MNATDLPSYTYMMRHYQDMLTGYWCISIMVGKLNSLHIGVQDDFGNWTEVPFK